MFIDMQNIENKHIVNEKSASNLTIFYVLWEKVIFTWFEKTYMLFAPTYFYIYPSQS